MPDCGAAETNRLKALVVPEHFEPLLAGDRQKEKRVAKRAIRCKRRPLKSVCRELPGVALAASVGRVYRLRMNRCVQAYRLQGDLERIRTRIVTLTECAFEPIRPAL